MGTKSLRGMSDTQFTAWLRAQGARGDIGVIKIGPGELMIPIEERVRVLNDLEQSGFYIPDVMGAPGDAAARIARSSPARSTTSPLRAITSRTSAPP